MSGNSSPTSIPGFSLPNLGDTSAGLVGLFGGGPVAGLVTASTNTVKNILSPQAPNLESPDAKSSTPTLAQTNTTALQKQLASESAARSSSTFLTGGQGLLDQPTTTSRVLLGA